VSDDVEAAAARARDLLAEVPTGMNILWELPLVALMILLEPGPQWFTDARKALGYNIPTFHELVKRGVALNVIERHNEGGDRKGGLRTSLSLTAKGHRARRRRRGEYSTEG
jgi:DNA-binding MarR family transcriptional regulator